MSQRNRLPAADRQLLDRLEREAPDPAQRAMRRRLFDGDLADFGGSCKRADTAMADMLGVAVGGDLDRRDRIVLLIVWRVIRDQDAEYFAPLEVPAQAPTSPAVQPAVPEVARTVAPPPIRAGHAAPTVQAQPPVPSLRAPCTAAAVEFLRAALAAGERESREVQAEGQRRGLTPAMIRAARQRLGIVTEKRGFGPLCRGFWGLPLVTTAVQCSSDRPARFSTDRSRSESRAVRVETHSVQPIDDRARCADRAGSGTEGQT